MKYVVLEHLTMPDRGRRFWSMNTDNNTNGTKEEPWYKVILLTDSTEEAIEACQWKNLDNLPSMSEIYAYWEDQIPKTASSF